MLLADEKPIAIWQLVLFIQISRPTKMLPFLLAVRRAKHANSAPGTARCCHNKTINGMSYTKRLASLIGLISNPNYQQTIPQLKQQPVADLSIKARIHSSQVKRDRTVSDVNVCICSESCLSS